MFQPHFHGEKHRKAFDRKHGLHPMLTKDDTEAQITTGAQNPEIEKVNRKKTNIDVH